MSKNWWKARRQLIVVNESRPRRDSVSQRRDSGRTGGLEVDAAEVAADTKDDLLFKITD